VKEDKNLEKKSLRNRGVENWKGVLGKMVQLSDVEGIFESATMVPSLTVYHLSMMLINDILIPYDLEFYTIYKFSGPTNVVCPLPINCQGE